MLRKIVFLAIAVPLCAPAAALASCTAADASFGAFLQRFKNDRQFRESRLVLPLQSSDTDPTGTVKTKLSLKQIRDSKASIIWGDAFALEMKGTEAALCESKVVFRNNRASFAQSSCETDVYSSKYDFVRKNGCWMLLRVANSGG